MHCKRQGSTGGHFGGLEEAWLRKTKRMRCGHANIMMHRAMWTYAVAIVYIMIIYMF